MPHSCCFLLPAPTWLFPATGGDRRRGPGLAQLLCLPLPLAAGALPNSHPLGMGPQLTPLLSTLDKDPEAHSGLS